MKKSAFLLAVFLGVFFFVQFSCAAHFSSHSQKIFSSSFSSAISSLSIPFIENKGQIDKDVAYYVKTFGGTLFVTKKGGMVYVFPNFAITERISSLTAAPKGLIPSSTNVSSFIGNDPALWHRALPTHTTISLGEIDDGITISLNAYGGKIEKIITVAPYTSPSIVLAMDGASSLDLDEEGKLIVNTDNGDIAFTRPVAFQDIDGKRIFIPIGYMLLQPSLTYTFALGSFDPSYTLTIDPILQSTYLGGGDQARDGVDAVVVGNDGVYVAGRTTALNFPGATGGSQPSSGGDYDGFVALLAPDLKSITQSTYLGGNGTDYIFSLAIGATGVYITGITSSSNFPGTTGGAQETFAGTSDAFVALLAPDLKSLVQSTYLGGSGYDSASSLALNANGVYVTGSTNSPDFPSTAGGAQPTGENLGEGKDDAFVALLAPDLKSLSQTTYLGGNGHDFANTLTLGSGKVYIAGGTSSLNFPGTTGGAQETFGGESDAFAALLAPDLKSITQATYLGGNGSDSANDLVLDKAGVYIAGSSSSNFPGTTGGAQEVFGGENDAFVALLAPDLKSVVQSTYLGGSGSDSAGALVLGSTGVYVAGLTRSDNFPGTAGGVQPLTANRDDAFVALLAPDLKSVVQSTYLGGNGYDDANVIALGTLGVYVGGFTLSTDFPAAVGGAKPSGGGDYDGFVALLTYDLKLGRRLTINKSGSGTGDVTGLGINCGIDCTEIHSSGAVVTLTASPDSKSVFKGWNGGGCSGTGPCEVIMNADVIVTAMFILVDSIYPISPPNATVFDTCSYFRPPTFEWTLDQTFQKLELHFYTTSNLTKPTKVKVKNPAFTQLLMPEKTWKKILKLPGSLGGELNWKIVGTNIRQDPVESEVFTMAVAAPQMVESPVIDPTSRTGPLPILSWGNACATKFKVHFSSDPTFTRKKKLSFTDGNPLDHSETFSVTLTQGKWNAIRKVVSDVSESPIYWYVESWDVIKRYKRTDDMEFILEP